MCIRDRRYLGHGSRRDGNEQDTSEKHYADDMGSCHGRQSKFKMLIQTASCLFESSHYEFAGLRCRDDAIGIEKRVRDDANGRSRS